MSENRGGPSRTVTVQSLVDARERLGITLQCGHQGLEREISAQEPVKPGLVLTGLQRAHGDAVHVMGRAEHEYLSVRSSSEQRQILMDYVRSGVPCVVMCWGLAPLPVLLELAEVHQVPIFTSLKATGDFIRELKVFLVEEMAPTEERHGVLVQVHDLGVMLTGQSGIGKSETALELLLRGHRMVADDVVCLRRMGDGLIGTGLPVLGQYVEVRGLGVLHAGDLFGQAAVVDSARLDLVVELVGWDEGGEADRSGLDALYLTFLGVDVPHIRLPVRPGRNIATIIEIAARNQILRKRGVNSAQRYETALLAQLQVPEGG
jgi:HPr kinase/phosphorylase